MAGEKQNIAYGSLYLDEGEPYEYAIKQVDYFISKRAKKIFFDLLGSESDRVVGEDWCGKLTEYIKKNAPYLRDEDIRCAFSTAV